MFGVGQGGPPAQGGASDIEGARKVFAAQGSEQSHIRVPLGHSDCFCQLCTRHLWCPHSERLVNSRDRLPGAAEILQR